MERIVKAHPAWDKRDQDPGKNYDLHGVDMDFILKGEEGTVVFTVYTNWYLPHLVEENPSLLRMPTPAAINYHWKKRKAETDAGPHENCEYLDGAPCYGSCRFSAIPEELMDLFFTKGSDAVWERMEELYKEYSQSNES